MATVVQNLSVFANSSAEAVNVASGDNYYLLENVRVINSGGGRGVLGAGSGNFSVNGELFGLQGLRINGADGVASQVVVGERGVIAGTSDGLVLETFGTLDIVNRGQITSLNESGIQYFGGNGGTVSNYGSIVGSDHGIQVNNGNVNIFNYGEISGIQIASVSYISAGSLSVDAVVNRGIMRGNVVLGGGADLYDGLGGRVDGEVRGGAGNDVLIGGLGADRLFGEGDNDNLYFDNEDLNFGVVDGGLGLDTGYNMDNVTALTIDLASRSLERYIGSAADEVVLATNVSVATIIRGGAGNDIIIGSAFADQLSGETGNDYIDGGAGIDTIDAGFGADTVLGGAGNDTIFGGDGGDIIEGGADDDTIIGDAGDDPWLFGGAGIDIIVGGLGNDMILGGDGNDSYLDGAEGSDQISGGAGNDTILGGAGDDLFLSGDAGNDFIVGGGGADVMIGGDGNDAFQFFAADYALGVQDRVTDFRVAGGNTDSLLLQGTIANYNFANSGSNTLITHTSGATIVLEGISAAAALGQTGFFV